MKNLLKYTLLLFLSALAACSNEDDAMSATAQPQSGDALELTVHAGDFVPNGTSDTRATDTGSKTTFQNGDRVGIIILDGSKNLLANNVPYKYSGNVWSFDRDNGEGKSQCYYDKRAVTYIVYFPYSKAADSVKAIDDLKKVFTPKADQSTENAYRASDLMTWSTGEGPKKTLNVKLEHAYASFSFSPTIKCTLDDEFNTPWDTLTISAISLTVDKEFGLFPYKASDGSYRYILPDGFRSGDIRCFSVFEDKIYNNTITISSVTANTRYTSASEIGVSYSFDDARVGDFYCRRKDNGEGYLIPGDVDNLTELLGDNSCVGVIYCVDSSFISESSTNKGSYSHGLVVALTDAGKSDAYGAPNNATQYGVMVPSGSSGWYLPNKDELAYICRGVGGGYGTAGKNSLNNQFSKVSGAQKFESVIYWSSTWGSTNSLACYVHFGNGAGSEIITTDSHCVRPVLAF